MTKLAESASSCEMASEILKALGHPLRIRIIALLCERSWTVGELASKLDAAQPVVSQQLRLLRMRDLVAATRERGFARYRLTEPKLRTLVLCMESCSFCQ
jgi:DNA-binding transcriptional ArsR family regulator